MREIYLRRSFRESSLPVTSYHGSRIGGEISDATALPLRYETRAIGQDAVLGGRKLRTHGHAARVEVIKKGVSTLVRAIVNTSNLERSGHWTKVDDAPRPRVATPVFIRKQASSFDIEFICLR